MEARKRRQRRSIRWAGHDYAQAGAYFVTICTADRQGPLGSIEGAEMRLSGMGEIAETCWRAIPDHFEEVQLGAFVVMPNHVHGIIVIGAIGGVGARHASPVPARARGPAARSLGAIVGSYKAAVSKRINHIGATPGGSIWHRNFYEHVIRSEKQLHRIRRYIEANPANWAFDRENPDAHPY